MLESTIVAEWMAEGKCESKRDSRLQVLGHRFPGPLPDDLKAAVTAAALDDFRAVVRI